MNSIQPSHRCTGLEKGPSKFFTMNSEVIEDELEKCLFNEPLDPVFLKLYPTIAKTVKVYYGMIEALGDFNDMHASVFTQVHYKLTKGKEALILTSPLFGRVGPEIFQELARVRLKPDFDIEEFDKALSEISVLNCGKSSSKKESVLDLVKAIRIPKRLMNQPFKYVVLQHVKA